MQKYNFVLFTFEEDEQTYSILKELAESMKQKKFQGKDFLGLSGTVTADNLITATKAVGNKVR